MHQLHHDERVAGRGAAAAEDLDDIAVAQPPEDLHLGDEALDLSKVHQLSSRWIIGKERG